MSWKSWKIWKSWEKAAERGAEALVWKPGCAVALAAVPSAVMS